MKKLTAGCNIQYNYQLFLKKYLYKIVLRTRFARSFRQLVNDQKQQDYLKKVFLDSQAYLDDFKKINYVIQTTKGFDFSIRIDPPWVTLYTNDFDLISQICLRFYDIVKYVSMPKTDEIEKLLTNNTVYVPECPYKYKVIIGSTRQNYTNFLQWAENHKKIELSQSARNQLSKDSSKNESWIYVADQDTLMLVKMFLGNIIKDTLNVVS